MRVRILAVAVLVLTISSLGSVLLLRAALRNQLDEEVSESLRREAQEFRLLAGGNDPRTGEPIAGDLEAIFEVHFSREVPDEVETLLAFLDVALPLTGRDGERGHDELVRLSRMVDDLFLLARAEHPDFLRPDRVEVATFLVDLHRRLSTLTPLELGVDVPDDPHRLARTVTQLVANAVKHAGPHPAVELGARVDGTSLVLWIDDDGPGVPVDEAPHVSDRSHRGVAAERRAGPPPRRATAPDRRRWRPAGRVLLVGSSPRREVSAAEWPRAEQ